MRLTPALNASSIFSLTISSVSRRARLPPAISFNIRSPTTWFASNASIIQEWSIRCFLNRRNSEAPTARSGFRQEPAARMTGPPAVLQPRYQSFQRRS